MKAVIARLMTGIWTILLFTAGAAIVVAPSAISAQEAGDELVDLFLQRAQKGRQLGMRRPVLAG